MLNSSVCIRETSRLIGTEEPSSAAAVIAWLHFNNKLIVNPQVGKVLTHNSTFVQDPQFLFFEDGNAQLGLCLKTRAVRRAMFIAIGALKSTRPNGAAYRQHFAPKGATHLVKEPLFYKHCVPHGTPSALLRQGPQLD